VTYAFDPMNRAVATTDPLGTITTTAYNRAGRVTDTTGPARTRDLQSSKRQRAKRRREMVAGV